MEEKLINTNTRQKHTTEPSVTENLILQRESLHSVKDFNHMP